jgi:hypothetical protein
MYGPVQEKEHWCLRWKSEIYSLYKYLNITDDINIRRLGSADNIIRMEDKRILKKLLNGKFHNTIPVRSQIHKMEGHRPKECITAPRSMRKEKTNWGYR